MSPWPSLKTSKIVFPTMSLRRVLVAARKALLTATMVRLGRESRLMWGAASKRDLYSVKSVFMKMSLKISEKKLKSYKGFPNNIVPNIMDDGC